jgi:hypothetical protein
MSVAGTATTDDAQLILRLYELRRDETMRAAREWFIGAFFPQSMEDITGIANAFGTKPNTYFRMVTSYWDMAASFVVHGSLNADLFLESGGELVVVWSKIADLVPQIREAGNKTYLSNIEKVVNMLPDAAERVSNIKTRLAQMREQAREQQTKHASGD